MFVLLLPDDLHPMIFLIATRPYVTIAVALPDTIAKSNPFFRSDLDLFLFC